MIVEGKCNEVVVSADGKTFTVPGLPGVYEFEISDSDWVENPLPSGECILRRMALAQKQVREISVDPNGTCGVCGLKAKRWVVRKVRQFGY
jgi:hypothetical protein